MAWPVSRKGADIGHMFLLNTDRKSYNESSTAPSDLASVDVERSKSMYQDLKA